MRIKMVDLVAQNQELNDAIAERLVRLHQRAAYVGGAEVAEFEEKFAHYLGVRHVVGVGSGTDALRLALLAAGVGPGDGVITTPLTFIGTVEGIVQVGARPLFADVDPETANLSPNSVLEYLEGSLRHHVREHPPRAILPVHLYGMPASLTELRAIAERHNLVLIEDACQAHGARLRLDGQWVRAGSVGIAGCFSFYPGKNLGGWGDGGAVATNDEQVAKKVISLRDHGRISHYDHAQLGYNSRLDALQAAVLSAKLDRLDAWNRRRRALATLYRKLLSDCELELPKEPTDAEACYHLFTIRTHHRDQVRQALLDNGIECGIHYPIPLHLQPACRFLGYRAGDFPIAERIAKTTLSLPLHPHMTESDVAEVCEIVRSALDNHSKRYVDGRN